MNVDGCMFNALRAIRQGASFSNIVPKETAQSKLMNKTKGGYFQKERFMDTYQRQPALGLSFLSSEQRVGSSRPPCCAVRGHPLTDQRPGMQEYNVYVILDDGITTMNKMIF